MKEKTYEETLRDVIKILRSGNAQIIDALKINVQAYSQAIDGADARASFISTNSGTL